MDMRTGDRVTARPNLFVVGAQKSGTTSLHAALAAHPEVFMSEPKEPGYFVPVHGRPREVYGFASTEEEYRRRYLELFEGAENYRYIGEATTAYAMVPRYESSARLIHDFNPDSRIIYIARDPIERTISHYWRNCEHGCETRSPLRAILGLVDYCSFSHYAMQLQPYVDRFSRDRIYVLTMEAFSADPFAETSKMFDWLGLPPVNGETFFAQRKNITPRVIVQKRSRILDAVQQSRGYNAVRRFIPGPVRNWAYQFNNIQIDRTAVDLNAVVEYLRPIQLGQTDELIQLLGRDFPEWKTLNGAAFNQPVSLRPAA